MPNDTQNQHHDPSTGSASEEQTAEPLTLEQRRVLTVQKAILPSITTGALNMERHADAPMVGAYLDDFAKRAGGPTDPVEEAMVRQLAQADMLVGQMLMQANIAKTPQAAAAFGNVGCRLLGEFRKLAISLKDYRSDNHQRRTTVIHHEVTHVGQQNIAEQQHVDYHREGGDEGGVSMNCYDTELGTKSPTEGLNYGHNRFQIEEETGEQGTGPCEQEKPCHA